MNSVISCRNSQVFLKEGTAIALALTVYTETNVSAGLYTCISNQSWETVPCAFHLPTKTSLIFAIFCNQFSSRMYSNHAEPLRMFSLKASTPPPPQTGSLNPTPAVVRWQGITWPQCIQHRGCIGDSKWHRWHHGLWPVACHGFAELRNISSSFGSQGLLASRELHWIFLLICSWNVLYCWRNDANSS